MISQLSDFYNNKKILITGHTGFKGTWLSIWLNLLGAKICGFSLPPTDDNIFFNLSKIDKSILSLYGDIRELNSFQKVITDFKPDIIIHLAAQAIVRKSYEKPLETYATNIMGTANLLEIVRSEKNIKAVINVTSDKCYENQNWLWGYRECDAIGGHDPYSSSKGCSEIITSAYVRSFFNAEISDTAIASARAGNLIGGGDFASDRLIPDMVRAFNKNKPVHIRNTNATRPWQYALEPLFGYLLLAMKLTKLGSKFNGGWNFGPQDDDIRNVSYLVDKFINIWGDNAEWIIDSQAHHHEATQLKLDCSKAQSLLGWQTKLNIDQAITWTVDWYKVFRDEPHKVLEFSEKQICDYEKLLNEIY